MTASVYVHIRNFHLPYLRQFQRLGWETHVGCAGIPDDAPFVDRSIDLPFEKKMGSADNFRAAWKLRRLIQTERYDLIITHTTLAAFFTRCALKGLSRRPKLVNAMHGYLFDDETQPIKRTVMLEAERLTAPQTDLLLVMNDWDLRFAKAHRLGKRIDIIPGMGVDFSRLNAASDADGRRLRERVGIPGDAFVLLYAAEFSERKSQRVLIRAMDMLPRNTVLVLCGIGETWDACRAMARASGASDRVRFPGQVADMSAWYGMADACVTASRSEGLPFNVMEAMYMGVPVVASAVKGHVDLIRDGETGLLYEYGDARSCAGQIKRLMEDPALGAGIAARARVDVARYGLDHVMPLVMERYLSMAAGQ